jgi:hypothetical protein
MTIFDLKMMVKSGLEFFYFEIEQKCGLGHMEKL